MSLVQRNEILWQSNAGYIDIRDMDDEHILNCVSLLMTKVKNFGKLTKLYDEIGDFDAKFLYDDKRNEILNWIETFTKELQRRELDGISIPRR